MSDQQQQLESGAYEVIRGRMEKHGLDLRERIEKLNTDRKQIFGAIDPALIATERISTEHNCVPRDMVSIGANRFLFGYNIQFGLKKTTHPSDVFDIYEYDPESHAFSKLDEVAIFGSEFAEDFQYLYKYYKQTTFVKFMLIGPHLYMGMRIGKAIDDIKTFKWLINGDGSLEYLGNRFDHEYLFPPQQEFEWIRAHRDMQRGGEHPHISIDDRIFVETVGGDLTIKVEDNTSDGKGIYEEEVSDLDQTLDDAEIFYASVGPLILLKILPYREEDYRYLVYNEKTQDVHRLDAIGHSCVLLPDEHGLIFANGYLQLSGEIKTFDHGILDMRFEKRIVSANGEDTLFVFYNRASGDYVLLSYNLIERSVENPIICSGYSLFPDGKLLYFRSEGQRSGNGEAKPPEPQKHHVIQAWQTPYLNDEFSARITAENDSFLFKIGNPDIVRCMAECREVLNLLGKEDSYAGLYLDLVKKTGDINDAYFWVSKNEAYKLSDPLREINAAANSAIDEFDKVVRLRQSTGEQTTATQESVRTLIRQVEHSPPDDIQGYVHQLTSLRTLRGDIIGLRDLRYVDLDLVASLEQDVVTATETVSQKTVNFLLTPEALDSYRSAVDEQKASIAKLKKVTEADDTAESLDNAGAELEMLIDVVSNLKIEDATQTTAIIESISSIYSTLNAVRAELKNKRQSLAKSEGTAQFGAQMKLLGQAVVNYLDLCDHPDKCEEYLTKVMVQIEELEGKFAEFDEYADELAAKREEVYDAFETRKTTLLEKRNKRAANLVKSAERVLSGIKHRAEGFKEINEINGYFAGDLMISKVRDIIEQLEELGDTVKAADIQTQLKTLKEDAVRQLKDRKELYVDGKNIIQFGKHKFNVNTQELQLSIVPRDKDMCFHLAGTDFFEPITEPAFLETSAVWEQEVISENKQVYRAEYLAYQFLRDGDLRSASQSLETEHLKLETLSRFAAERYTEAYTKGVHDQDAFKILEALLPIHKTIGLLRFSPAVRAAAMLFWHTWESPEKSILESQLHSISEMRKSGFASNTDSSSYLPQLTEALSESKLNTLNSNLQLQIAKYLFAQLSSGSPFVVSPEANNIIQKFNQTLTAKRAKDAFETSTANLTGQAKYQTILDWIISSRELSQPGEPEPHSTLSILHSQFREAAAHLLMGQPAKRDVHHVEVATEINGLLGSHTVIDEGNYQLHYNAFMDKLDAFESTDVPTFQAYQRTKQELTESKRDDMRLHEFQARVMSAFVRNKLLNDVYLPMIGDNLAKQMGTAGVDTRTDRMGLLLLISPPGYGKTTLMEYVANRLGLTFMKINGPAIGHAVTSLDPNEAPNASAREEVEKLNLALEMGDNVMLYLDDIQHCNPEFLQKFISLCDAQRKIEGVYNGQAKTYDLRGKTVSVVMAGNPYTESGGKFQIPDMLANRADTYNLGDIIGGHAESFKASYIENSLTSNSVLSKLASRSQKDVYAVMQVASSGSQEGVDFEGNYTASEIDEFVKTTQHLYTVRDTILSVNLQYIRSAAQEDAYRTEPAFKLQGSYRNMNRIAEKVLPLMTHEEVRELIIDHYENESQTLTTGAEANLLKFKEMEGILTKEEAKRWEQIKKDFNKNKVLGAAGENDPLGRVVAQMTMFNDGLDAIQEGIAKAGSHYAQPQTLAEDTISQLEKIIAGLRAVPVEVDINLIAEEEDGVEGLEKTSRKPPINVKPEIRQKD
ncbi:DNA repair ATPase [Verrucomicrobiaceae bacterium N1E253]|uniref:DNA repair ATPase n=1 Tax=Oceaniferula marina TaxID=2748318 RepID=A0A851GLK1_9BACT|nr:DNA repair ATPase [Oceaniferula marina]NWK55957.1 DNA repair ATPase [Oceaniferula marina]